ncbi:flippase [Streptococcus infantarius]|uniref:flippase n=3 Tax=Streptococcus TaxID=1301 RepID=UPI0022E5F19F|nr:flippase [Streptococcus infantarius]
MKKKSLVLNAALNGLRNILNLIFPLITFPYVTRVLSVSGIGEYNFANSIVSYFLLLAGLGVSKYGVREGAKYRDDIEKESKFVSEVFTINMIATILAYILLAVVIVFSDQVNRYAITVIIFSLQIFFTTIGVEWLFSMYEEYTYITIRSIIFKIISVVLLFLFVRDKNDVGIYAAITVFSSVGSNILNYIRARKMVHIRFRFRFDWNKHLKSIMILFASSIAIQIYVNSGITILGFMKDTYTVGLYSVSSKIYTIVKNGLAAILIVTIPRLSMLWGKNLVREYKTLFKDIFNGLLLVMFPSMVGLIMLSKQVVLIISGEEYISAVSSLRILCLALICSIISWIFNDGVLIPTKREKYALYSTIISAILNIIASFLLIGRWGQDAAALAVLIAEAAGMIMNIYWSRDIIKLKDILETHFGAIIGCIIIIVECALVNRYISGNIISTIVAIIVSVLTYTIMLIIFKDRFSQTFLNRLKFRQ